MRSLLSATGPTATVLTTPANVTAPGSTGTSIVVQYTDSAGISIATLTAANLSVGVGGFAPSDPAVPITIATISPNTDSTAVTVTYNLGAPRGAFYSQDDDVYHVELNGSSVYDDAGVAAAANPLLSLYQVVINPLDASFAPGALGFATNASITQPDGKLLLVGSQNPAAPQAVLERLNPNGAADTTFASAGGLASTPADDDAFNAVGLGGNGDIIVAGSSNGDLLLALYSHDGAPIGQTITPIDLGAGITATLNGLSVASDNTVYAVGSESNGSAIVVHYLADGTLDTSFGPQTSAVAGIDAFAVGSAATSLSSVAFADNELVVAGSSGSSAFVAQLTPAGSFAPGFNSGAPEILTGVAAGMSKAHSPALALAGGGDFYVAAHIPSGDLAIERLTSAGDADPAFGDSGIATTHFGPAGTAETDDADTILVRADGTVVVTGTSDGQSAIAVYTSAGAPFSQFVKDAFSPTSDPTVTSDSAVATLSGNNAVVMSTTGNGTVASEFDIASGQTTTTPTTSTTSPTSPPTAPTSPITPITTTPAPTVIGTLGKVNGKRVSSLSFTTSTGATVTLKFTGAGTAEALRDGNDIDLVLTGANLHLSATSTGAFTIGTVSVTGSLALFKAADATLAGTLSSTGNLNTIQLGSITGAISAAGKLQHLLAASASAASHFQAAGFGVIKLPGRIKPASDSRFVVS